MPSTCSCLPRNAFLFLLLPGSFVCAVVGGRQPRYGSIVKYQWFGDGYMMIGFSNGFVVVISTHMKEIVEELFSGRFHKVRRVTACVVLGIV